MSGSTSTPRRSLSEVEPGRRRRPRFIRKFSITHGESVVPPWVADVTAITSLPATTSSGHRIQVIIPVSFLMPSEAQKVAMRGRIPTCEPGLGLRMTEKLSADRVAVVVVPCTTIPSDDSPSEEEGEDAISSATARGSSRVFFLAHPIDDNGSARSADGR